MSDANRSPALPPPAAERWLLVGMRYPALRAAALTPARTGGWKSATLLSRVLFFLLGLGAAGATMVILAAVGNDQVTGVVAGTALLMAGEVLIRTRRTISSGFEEALWVAGGLSFAVLVPGSFDSIEWTVAVALLLAGARLRNPLLVTLGAIAVSVALAMLGESGGILSDGLREGLAASWCYLVAALALAAGGQSYARPSTDRILNWLVVVLPVAGWGWLQGNGGLLRLDSVSMAALVPVLLPLLFGIVAGVIGTRRRTHAPLIALLACVGCVAIQLRELTGLELHWRLIFWGSVGLIAAIALERWLRTPRAGITSRNLDENLAALDLVQYAGVASATAGTAPPPGSPAYQGEGGRFGGGGASGQY